MATRRVAELPRKFSPLNDEERGLLSASSSAGITARAAAYKSEAVVDAITPPTYTFLYGLLALLGAAIVVLTIALIAPAYARSSTASTAASLSTDYSVLGSPPPPEWVLRYRVDHLFHYTWFRNGHYAAYTRYIREHSHARPPSVPPSPSSASHSAVVNDAVSYFEAHPGEGVVVDFSPLLPNPSPHPLPLARSWPEMCSSLRLEREWATCSRPQSELNDWLPATTHVVTVGVFDAFVDLGSCNGYVPGTPFTLNATFHLQRWTNSPCYNDPIDLSKVDRGAVRHYAELIDTVGTYLSATGHFAPQQLPRIIRSLALCPPSAKVLVSKGGIADVLMDVLVERGLVARERIVQLDGPGLYHGHVVYRSDSWPYLVEPKYNHYAHDRSDMQLVHRTMVDDLPDAQRDLVIVVQRSPGPRHLADHDALVANLSAELRSSPQAISLGLRCVSWDARGHVREHIELFKRAKVLIGPHGAGMLNLYWLKPGSHVVEIGYDRGMTFPEMYAEMALHSDHHYHVVRGEGDYDGDIRLNWADLAWTWREIVSELSAAQKQSAAHTARK